jgi:hypothetical protein
VLQDYIQEWQSPNFHSLEVQPFLWMLLLTAAVLALSPNRPTWRELLRVTSFAYLGLVAARNIGLFALVALPVLNRHLAATLHNWLPARASPRQLSPGPARALNLVLLLLLIVAAGIKAVEPLSRKANEAAVRQQTPVEAVEAIRRSRPPGPLLNSYNWGSYLIWALYPDYLSFVDGRTDLFDDEILEEYLQVWRADPGWERVVDRWGLKSALLEPEAPLVQQLRIDGWTAIYADQQAVVLTKD